MTLCSRSTFQLIFPVVCEHRTRIIYLELNAYITICHKNIPNMLGQLTGACAAEGINIEDMTNKSKGDWAYTMMDIGSEVSEALVEKLAAINGVVKVRKVK